MNVLPTKRTVLYRFEGQFKLLHCYEKTCPGFPDFSFANKCAIEPDGYDPAANQDGKVTIYDVVILRKLILGISDTLPNGKSWRFIPEHYIFPHPSDPFQPFFPEKFEIQNGEAVKWGPYFFTGVKIGDVNFSADPHQ